jgi:nucleoid DNA-binding protein
MTQKNKNMTASQIRQKVADLAGLTLQQSKLALEALQNLVVEQVNSNGTVTVPGVCKITKVIKPAKPERKMISPLTKQEITVKAKPASVRLKIKPVKQLKDSAVVS